MHFINSTNIKLVLDNYTDLYRDMPNCRYIDMFKFMLKQSTKLWAFPYVPMGFCTYACMLPLFDVHATWIYLILFSHFISYSIWEFLVESFILNIVVTIRYCIVCIFYILTLLCGLQPLWLIEFEKHIRINLHHQWCFSQVIFLKLYYYYIFSPINSNDFAVTSIMSSVLIGIL